MGRTNRAASCAVTGIKCRLHIDRRHGTASDPLQRSNDTAHLVMQKGPRAHVEMHFGAIVGLNRFDPDLVDSFYRAGRLTNGRAKSGEVVLTHQNGSRLAHGVKVHLLLDLPDKAAQMRERRAARQNAKKIAPFERAKSGVECVGHSGTVCNRHRVRFEVIIDRFGQAEGRPIAHHVAMGDLSNRMHTAVRAPCGGNLVRAFFQLGQRILNRPCHRGEIVLALPAVERRTVIFNFESISRHKRGFIAGAGLWQSLRVGPI